MERLVLGTAQMGMPYGVTNWRGQPDFGTAKSIIRAAWESGIREFDTAQAYGKSECILGKMFQDLGICNEAKVVSKLHPGLDHFNRGVLHEAVERSLDQLKVPRLHALLLHGEDLLDRWEDVIRDNLLPLCVSGLVENLGISVYSPAKALQALNEPMISVVQIPSNILDRRFENAQVFTLAEAESKYVYVRSVFLQGLLLMDWKSLPEKVAFAASVLNQVDCFCNFWGLSRKELVLGYAKVSYPMAKIIIGSEHPDQILENVKIWDKEFPIETMTEIRKRFEIVEERILNPALWAN